MNRLAFRSGQVRLIRVAVDADTVIEAGDLVWLDTDDAKPASAFAWNTSLGQTQEDFAEKFLGVAHTPSPAGTAGDISVDVSPHAVYEFECNSDAYVVGNTLGPDKASGNAILSQVLEAATAARSIARAAETSGTTTRLRVTFASAFATGSANVNAALG